MSYCSWHNLSISDLKLFLWLISRKESRQGWGVCWGRCPGEIFYKTSVANHINFEANCLSSFGNWCIAAVFNRITHHRPSADLASAAALVNTSLIYTDRFTSQAHQDSALQIQSLLQTQGPLSSRHSHAQKCRRAEIPWRQPSTSDAWVSTMGADGQMPQVPVFEKIILKYILHGSLHDWTPEVTKSIMQTWLAFCSFWS